MLFSLRRAALACALAIPLCLTSACSSSPRPHAHSRTDTKQAPTTSEGVAAAPKSMAPQRDDIAASMKNLLDGTMRYQVPTTMTIGESEVVTLRISSSPNDTSIASDFSGTSDSVKFADSIRASLYGGNDFTVVARQGGDPQLLPPTGFAVWEWDVKPTHAGKSRLLTLRLDTYVHIHGRDVFYGTTKETKVTVKVNPALQMVDFAKDHLEWLWGLLVIPAAEFLRRRFGRGQDIADAAQIETIAGVIAGTEMSGAAKK